MFGSSFIDQSVSRWVLKIVFVFLSFLLFYFCGINGSIEWSILICLDTIPIERDKERDLTNWRMGSCKGGEKFLLFMYRDWGSFLSSWTLSASLAWSCGVWNLDGGICWCWYCNCTNQLRKRGDCRLYSLWGGTRSVRLELKVPNPLLHLDFDFAWLFSFILAFFSPFLFFCCFLFYFVALHNIFDQKGVRRWGFNLTPSLRPTLNTTCIHRHRYIHTTRTKIGIFWFLETFMVKPWLAQYGH